MRGKRVDCYLDLASFFSYVGFRDLLANIPALAANGVEVEFHPILLGGVNSLSGNQPPWTLEAKAKYLDYDSKRAADRVGLTEFQTPEDLMAHARTISPLRALHYIKANYPTGTFLSALHFLFYQFWAPPNVNLTVDENLRDSLLKATETPEGGRKLFTEKDVNAIMDGRAKMKDSLKNTTGKAVELGAFGAPWIWATNAEGQSQPFFGSDRFNHIYKYLGIPFQDVSVLTPSKL